MGAAKSVHVCVCQVVMYLGVHVLVVIYLGVCVCWVVMYLGVCVGLSCIKVCTIITTAFITLICHQCSEQILRFYSQDHGRDQME